MLLWLNGTENVKDAPNENYGREMMELFTLGADRGAYTEEDVRQQARSLTGWQNRWGRSRGDYDFHFDAKEHDTGIKTVFHKQGAFDWKSSCRLCVGEPDARLVLRQQALELLHPDAARQADGRRRSRRSYKQGYQVRPVVSAILQHPDLYEGQRMVKPPVVHVAGLLRRIGDGITTTAWSWIGQISGQQLFYPPNVAGWDDTRWLDTATFRGRWEGVQQVLQNQQPSTRRSRRRHADHRAAAARRARSTSGTSPQLSPGTTYQLNRFADARAPRRQGRLGAEGVPVAGRERAAPTDRSLTGHADLMSAITCDECTRADLVPRDGGPRPADDRARHAAARRHRPDAPEVRREVARRSRCPSTAPAGSSSSTRGSRTPRRSSTRRSSSASSCRAAPTRSRCSTRRATRSTRSSAPTWRSPAGRRSPRIRRLYWNPALAPLAQLHAEGKVTVLPAIGYDHPDQSHFTSRHYWEVGATDPRLLTGWLGRYLDVAGVADNPLQGLSITGQPRALAGDRARCRSRRSTARTSTASARRASGAASRTACSTRWARSAACTRTTPRSAPPRT